MHRPPSLLLATFALLGLAACSGGGASSPGNAVVELGSSPLSAVGGGIAVVTAPAPLFVPGSAFVATWFDASGTARAVGQAAASSRENCGLLAPTLPAGPYRVDVELGAATGRLSVQLAEVAAIADPSASLGAWHAAAQVQVASWRAAALSVVDPALRASRLADLDEIDRRLGELIGKLASASSAERLQAARLLSTEPDLSVTPAAGGPEVGLESLELARIRQVDDQLRAGTGLMVHGATALVAAAQGLFGVADLVGSGSSLPAAAAVAAGLLAHYAGGLVFAEGVERGVTPQSGLQVEGAVGDGLAGSLGSAPSLFLVPGVPLRLQPTALCASLTTNDRLSPSAEVRALFLPIDAAYRAFAERPAVLSALVQTPPAAVPELPRSERLPVDRSRLSIADQGNPQVQLTVVAGDLTAALQGVAAPVTTTVTFLFDAAPFAGLSQTLTVAGIALRPNMVPIAAGTFTMGSAIGSVQGASSAGPPHTVTHTLPFWMGKYEVTQAEYETLIGSNPSFFLGANRPVDRVSWDRAVAFCEALTVQEAAAGRLPSGHSYRLPTEAEWEYCCRAGTTTEWNVGSSLACGQANYSGDAFVFCVQETSVVGSYPANAWGLHDMHGNVQELCRDGWDGTAGYAADAVVDPFVPSGLFRVLRGGGWSLGSDFCRSAHRGTIVPPFWANDVGIRIVCAPVR